jgi:hypothetical protein
MGVSYMLKKQPLTAFHANEARRVLLKHIKGYVPHLDHMCVTVSYRAPKKTGVVHLFDGDDNRQLLMLSPIDKIEDHYYNKTGYAKYDLGLSAKHYLNFTMYPWKDGTFGPQKKEIDRYKEDVYGLHSGYFISVDVGDGYYLIFGIASHCKDPRMGTVFANNIYKIIEAGMAYYSYLLPFMKNHVDYELPSIDDAFIKTYNLEQKETAFEQEMIFPGEIRKKATNQGNRTTLKIVR